MEEQLTLEEAMRRKRLGGEGILTKKDLDELNASTVRVFELMKDGLWHTAAEIEMAAGVAGIPARGGTRRMRELRKHFEIKLRRLGDGRNFEYRLTQKED
jgi:hypothetical protein